MSSISSMTSSLGQATSKAESAMSDFASTMDTTNTGDLLQYQSLTQNWSVCVGLESGSMKNLGDSLKSLVQKIG
ncbi:EscF/YscF/HrpA family type III secretion system needle major subunit [Hyphomicrobium sp. MC1]|uniref:EscF/YscF/HrpA family type III secretion system needle major subunit n=1 Tax=Hyphomicrobium sp. (strain MC1) TaxID=717785 RepID=UPI000213F229|nr:protein of unknown function [Hyphomicrobium sp. MC1]